jgi:octaprenyl-diphosphate synthase
VSASTRGTDALKAALLEIQAPVREQLDRTVQEMWRIVAMDGELMPDVTQHLMGMKGKMFRPTLLLLSSEVEGAAAPSAVTMAAVVELIHLATLVHDDAVDHSVLRRGMPTINAIFSHQVSVIFGDFLYSRALLELVERGDLEPLRVFTRASNQLTLGEIRQLGAVDRLSFSEQDYEKLIRHKTAVLFRAACEVGALSGAPRHREALARFGERLGMAFQVADDLIDYTEQQETTGKPGGHDLKEHKVTLPLIAALRTISPAARTRVEALFAAPEPSDAQVEEVVGIVAEAGGLDYARRRGEEYAHEAEAALSTLPPTPARAALADALAYCMDRRS